MMNDKTRQDNTCGEGRISIGGQPRPYRKGAGPQRSPIFLEFLLLMHTPFDAKLPNFTW